MARECGASGELAADIADVTLLVGELVCSGGVKAGARVAQKGVSTVTKAFKPIAKVEAKAEAQKIGKGAARRAANDVGQAAIEKVEKQAVGGVAGEALGTSVALKKQGPPVAPKPKVEVEGAASGKHPSSIRPDEQPWNIRPGQEWKSKIVGRGQKTGTPGHRFDSLKLAIKEAKKSDTKMVYLDRSMNRILREEGIVNPKIVKNRRHDVTTVKHDGKIDLVEVQSKTDDPRKLRKRMDETQA